MWPGGYWTSGYWASSYYPGSSIVPTPTGGGGSMQFAVGPHGPGGFAAIFGEGWNNLYANLP